MFTVETGAITASVAILDFALGFAEKNNLHVVRENEIRLTLRANLHE